MRIIDWSSDVCSSDLLPDLLRAAARGALPHASPGRLALRRSVAVRAHESRPPGHSRHRALPGETDRLHPLGHGDGARRRALYRAERFSQPDRSEEHTSELQSIMRISYADLCLKKHNKT